MRSKLPPGETELPSAGGLGVGAGRCLVVATDNRFWRAQMGSQVRIEALVAHFRSAGWTIRVAFHGRPYLDDAERASALPGVEVHFLHPGAPAMPQSDPRAPGWLARARSLVGRGSRLLRAVGTQWRRHRVRGAASLWAELGLRAVEPRVGDRRDPAFINLVERLASATPHAVVLVEYLRLAWVALELRPRLPHATWIVDTHDVMHERQARFHASGEAHELDVSAREEARWLSCFDAVLAIQARDARTFVGMGVSTQVLTAPHPVPARRIPSRDPSVVGVGFLGSNMAPNRAALQELVFEVWPLVLRKARTPVRLVVAGAVSEILAGHGDLPPSVQVMGFVADTAEFYRLIDILASPVRVGGGLKIKNVEALCHGKALVTTAVGAEGLEPGLPHALAVTSDAEQMADVLLDWVNAPTLLAQRMEAGYGFAQQAFDPAAAFQSLDQFLQVSRQRA